MNDAEGIRNLVGTGLVQLVGSVVTAILALACLFYLNWMLTIANIVVLGSLRRRDGVRVQDGCVRCFASAARSTRTSRDG